MTNTFVVTVVKRKWFVGLVVVAVGVTGYFVYRSTRPTAPLQYVLSPVTRQTVVASVSATGQVSGENQLDIKPTVSGKILNISVKQGDMVATTTVLLTIDATAAQKTVRDAVQAVNDARLSLASSQLSLDKLRLPTDALTLQQAQHAVDQNERAVADLVKGPDPLDIVQAQEDLAAQQRKVTISADGKTPQMTRDAYDNTVPILRAASQTVQTALRDLDNMIHTLGQTNLNGSYEYSLLVSAMDTSGGTTGNLYQNVLQSGTDLKAAVDVMRVTNEDTKHIDAALPLARAALDPLTPLLQRAESLTNQLVASSALSQASIDSMKSSIHGDRSDVAAKTSAIVSAAQSLAQAQNDLSTQQANVQKAQLALQKLQQGADPSALATARERLSEARASLAKLQQGPSVIDIASAQNGIEQRRSSLTQAQHRLTDAQQALQDYQIRAPFDGIVANIPVKMGDQASGGTAVATLLTTAKLAAVSLNEIDVSKVAIGQRATVTFDALPDIQIAGSVSQIDTLGTVTQGVVNYAVKIAFLTQDTRIKPGMSVTVSIITQAHTDVLTVPNAAVRQSGTQATVNVLNGPVKTAASGSGVTSAQPPEVRDVQVGIANDQVTEIISGLSETDQVVTRTIDPKTVTNAPSSATGVRIPGLTTGGTGGFGGSTGGGRTGPTGGRVGG
ncbi:efflux RND transporter periplasmic adaptor subunit [Patescibacteria group bacterium]|nr:efflux RND transporter periplasmic adaptor subunit [Patescibacteria group bacterium]